MLTIHHIILTPPGDVQKKLDVLSNEMFMNALYNSNVCAVLVSEENDDPIIVPPEISGSWRGREGEMLACVSLCVCVFMCVYVCVYICVFVHIHMWRHGSALFILTSPCPFGPLAPFQANFVSLLTRSTAAAT